MNPISFALWALGFVIILKIISIAYHEYILRKTFKDIPNTGGYPLIGSVLRLIGKSPEERLKWYLSFTDQFKDGVVLEWIGNKPIIRIFKPEFIEIILASTIHVDKGIGYNMLKHWLGNGILISRKIKWLQDRKLMTPAFNFNTTKQYVPIMWEKAEILLKCLEREIERSPGKAIDIYPFAVNVTLDIICETAMGVNIHAQEEVTNYTAAIHRNAVLTVQRFFQPWYWWDLFYYLTPVGKEHRSVVNILHGFTKEVIRKKKNKRQLGENDIETQEDKHEIGKPKQTSFLDLLLDLNEKENAALSDDEIREQVDTLMFAGHDTTSLAITWTLFCLGNHLECQEKVHEELEQVFEGSHELIDASNFSQLKYLERVIKESMRLYPSVPYLIRKLGEDVTFADYTLPKDCTVILSSLLLHRHPEVWPDPLKFDPDRFLPENSKNRSPYAYIPFSAGPRNCIGQKFGQIELKMILSTILRKWRVKSVQTFDTILFNTLIVLRPSEKVLLHFVAKK